jgi:hypothetical protein
MKRICIRCNIEKEESEFYRERKVCLICTKIQRDNRSKKRVDYYNANKDFILKNHKITKKVCSGCKEEKFLSEFWLANNTKDYTTAKCAVCTKKYSWSYSQNELRPNKIRDEILQKQEDDGILKYCPNCETEKSICKFRVSGREGGYYDFRTPLCIECGDITKKELAHEKYMENQQYNINKSKAYNKKKYHEDKQYKILSNLRSRLHTAVTNEGHNKYGSTMGLVGCSGEDLVFHLENQFTERMSWDNHTTNGWHIDHIIPCNYFDLSKEENQRICFHYLNLQPLWWNDNLSKKKNHIPDNIEEIVLSIKEELGWEVSTTVQ